MIYIYREREVATRKCNNKERHVGFEMKNPSVTMDTVVYIHICISEELISVVGGSAAAAVDSFFTFPAIVLCKQSREMQPRRTVPR